MSKDNFNLEDQNESTDVLKKLEAKAQIKQLQKRFNLKPKSKKGALGVLIVMNLLIGFMIGFSINQFVPMNEVQSILLNLDSYIVNLFGGLI